MWRSMRRPSYEHAGGDEACDKLGLDVVKATCLPNLEPSWSGAK